MKFLGIAPFLFIFYSTSIFSVNKNTSLMGMNYNIHSNIETNCQNNFPYELSYFFEQFGGFGNNSEVAQVSDILKIDLATFQEYDYGTIDSIEEKTFWKDIQPFCEIIETFISKLESTPNYYLKVKYNPNSAKQTKKEFKALKIKDEKKRIEKLMELQSQSSYRYPVDKGYLKTGRILIDLKLLKELLNCYKKSGVTKIKLTYY
ncbi:MAG: hypothetical protein SFU21_14215 [Flavihumibacter sp.]|nr:hypothetical protein [Flavihumibacter sp.]